MSLELTGFLSLRLSLVGLTTTSTDRLAMSPTLRREGEGEAQRPYAVPRPLTREVLTRDASHGYLRYGPWRAHTLPLHTAGGLPERYFAVQIVPDGEGVDHVSIGHRLRIHRL